MKTQKTWLITGASRGFGLEIAKAVLATGDNVIGTVRSNPDSLTAALDNHPNLLVVNLEVTNSQQSIQATETAIARFGQIDVLVNNAGYGILAAVEEATEQEVKDVYETNVFGTLNMIRAVLPYMRENGKGHIINVSSVGGLFGYIGWGVYGSTKFAIEGITESLSQEVKPLGIHATVVAPGFFRTNFLDGSSLSQTSNIIDNYDGTVGAMREFAKTANHNQPGDPLKLAQAFVKLAASENPPLHLLLGNDTLKAYREKTAAMDQDIENWMEVTTGTDHDS